MHKTYKLVTAFKDRLFLRADAGSIGIGLIGIGGWGLTNAVNIMRTRKFKILGVHDKNKEILDGFASKFNVLPYYSIKSLLSDSRINSVAITVPNNFHEEMVKLAADAGKDIFIEKPLASSSYVCKDLGKYCNDKKVILLVGHQMRREPVFRFIKNLLNNEDLGCPIFAQAVSTVDRRMRNDWRKDPNACPGGSMEQLGVHVIDVLLYLFGTPRKVHSMQRKVCSKGATFDWDCISLLFGNDFQANVSTSFSSPRCMHMEVYFENGNLVTDGKKIWISRNSLHNKIIKPCGIPGSFSQFFEFAECIQFRNVPETGYIEAAETMNIVESIFSNTQNIIK